jgi:hypothetical protein
MVLDIPCTILLATENSLKMAKKKKSTVKLSLYQAVEAHRVVRY